jgi:hypothetical protein
MNTAQADGEVGLDEFLGDDLGGGLRVQEEVAQDLAHHLVGAAVMGFGSGLLGFQGPEAPGVEGGQELVVALAAKAVFLSEGRDVGLETLALHEHEEAAGQVIGGGNGQSAHGPGQLVGVGVELKSFIHGPRIAAELECV